MAEIISHHPEVALYKTKVIAHGREFLQSEYCACKKIEEKKACEHLYGVGIT